MKGFILGRKVTIKGYFVKYFRQKMAAILAICCLFLTYIGTTLVFKKNAICSLRKKIDENSNFNPLSSLKFL
jgi:hypothetical protein